MRADVAQYLQEQAAALGIAVGKKEVDLAWQLLQEVQQANRKMNLTSITGEEEFARKHILDSWVCCRFIAPPGRLVDVGSGAGFPGIPIKIVCPALEVVLLEASQKKCGFLESTIARLGLQGIAAANCRAEEAGHKSGWREGFDFATCRAVGALPVVAEYCLPLLRVGGRLLAQRGREGEQEAAAAKRAIEELGGEVALLFPYALEEGERRWLVVVEKVRPTPLRYPRRSSAIIKRPLFSTDG